MKKLLVLLIFMNLNVCFGEKENNIELKAEKETVDEIKARVNGINITKKDLEKPQAVMGGERLSLEAAINNELLFQKANERNLLATAAEVDKQIASLKINNGIGHLSDEEFGEELKQEGLTLKEYKDQMARFIATERLKGAEFNERVVVTEQEIKDYYEKNPSWSEEKYWLHICDLNEQDIDADGNLLKKENLNWVDLGWIKKIDLNSNLLFVTSLEKGEISKPIKIDSGYQLIKVVDKSEQFLRSLLDRRSEIEELLKNQKREKFAKDFEKELRRDASIVYLT